MDVQGSSAFPLSHTAPSARAASVTVRDAVDVHTVPVATVNVKQYYLMVQNY